MFTLEQIKAAHSKVKSGADFPNYIKDLKKLGITGYATYVNDGHTVFHGTGGTNIFSDAKYDSLPISDESNAERFKERLKAHQKGETDYPTFCNDCAVTGIEKWVMNIKDMTCIYYDKAGNKVLTEQIPQA